VSLPTLWDASRAGLAATVDLLQEGLWAALSRAASYVPASWLPGKAAVVGAALLSAADDGTAMRLLSQLDADDLRAILTAPGLLRGRPPASPVATRVLFERGRELLPTAAVGSDLLQIAAGRGDGALVTAVLRAAEPDGRQTVPRTGAAIAAARAGHIDIVRQLLEGGDTKEIERLLQPDPGASGSPSVWEQLIDADRPAELGALLALVPSDSLLRAILAPERGLVQRCAERARAEAARVLLGAASETLRAQTLSFRGFSIFRAVERSRDRNTFLRLLDALTPEGMQDLMASASFATLNRMVHYHWGDVIFEILGRVPPQTRKALLGKGDFNLLRLAAHLDTNPAIFMGLFKLLDDNARATFLAKPESLTLAVSCGCDTVARLAWKSAEDDAARRALLAHDDYACIDVALFNDCFASVMRLLEDAGELHRVGERLRDDDWVLLRLVVETDRVDLVGRCLYIVGPALSQDVLFSLLRGAYKDAAEQSFAALLRLVVPNGTLLDRMTEDAEIWDSVATPGLRRRLVAALSPSEQKALLYTHDVAYPVSLVRRATHRGALEDLLKTVRDPAATRALAMRLAPFLSDADVLARPGQAGTLSMAENVLWVARQAGLEAEILRQGRFACVRLAIESGALDLFTLYLQRIEATGLARDLLLADDSCLFSLALGAENTEVPRAFLALASDDDTLTAVLQAREHHAGAATGEGVALLLAAAPTFAMQRALERT
jgi:hypothetical protein